MPPIKKQLHMYCSRKKSMPQRVQWPLVHMRSKYFCFAHLQQHGRCNLCSFDTCVAHAKIQKECALCGCNRFSVNAPCGKHAVDIGNCCKCTGGVGFLSYAHWRLCAQHERWKNKLLCSATQAQRILLKTKIVQCLVCTNTLETLKARQRRNSLLINSAKDAKRRPRKRVKYDEAEVDGDDNLDEYKSSGAACSKNID